MTWTTRRNAVTIAVLAGLAGGLVGCGNARTDTAQAPVIVEERPSATTATAPPVSSQQPASTPKATTSTRATTPKPPTPAGTPAKTTPAAKPSAKPSVKPSATPDTSPERQDLRYGDRGADVRAVQERLSALGYWLGEPDGHFGHLTQQAVWALQKSAGLSRDGRVGPRTLKALEQGIRPATTLRGDGVDINLKRQILMIVRDGRVRYILNTSTGGGYEYEQKDGDRVTARTPKGRFAVYYTVDGKDEGFLGDMWRPRYFKGGYAVHGSPSIPAYPASHGCARVSNSAMNLIWSGNLMPKGSTVQVR